MFETERKRLFSHLRSLDRFRSWWIDELSNLADDILKKKNVEERNILVFYLDKDRINISLRSGQTWREVGQMAPADLHQPGSGKADKIFSDIKKHDLETIQAVIRLPRNFGLRKRMRLPHVAKSNIRAVLFNQIDRITPFSPEQVYFDYRLIDDGQSSDQLELELHIIPKDKCDQTLALIKHHGIKIDCLELEEGGERPSGGVNFLAPLGNGRRSSEQKKVTNRRAWLVLCLMGFISLMPLGYNSYRIRVLQAEVTASRLEARSSARLKATYEKLRADVSFLIDKKNARPLAIHVVSEISALLNDGTWLDQLKMKADSVQLYGYSESASKILEDLEQSPLLRNAHFMAAVVHNKKYNAERFQIAVDLNVDFKEAKGDVKPHAPRGGGL